MGTFIAVERVSRIEWNFEGVTGTDGKPIPLAVGKGILAEPSPEDSGAYLAAYQRIVEMGMASAAQVRRRLVSASESGETSDDPFTTSTVAPEMTRVAKDALAAIGVPNDLLEMLPGRMIGPFASLMKEELTGEGDAASLID